MKKYQKVIISVATLGMAALMPANATLALSQDETVYTKLESDGSVSETSVVEHLKNSTRDYQLFDQTILGNIENLNGFESFKVEDGKVVWDANGNDIYYRGETQKELPIQVAVTYKLDGVEKSLDEIIGASGKVEISYKFKNLSKVGGLYTPFVAALTTTFKEGAVSNLEVTNGKAESDGRTIAVAAVAAPGLYESLGIDELRNSDEITLTFETEKFELNDIYIAVAPKLLDSEDLRVFGELNSLYEDVNTLANSSKQLVNGSASLKNGLGELQSGVIKAKQQASAISTSIDTTTMTQIKTTAANGAAQAVSTKRAEIEAGVEMQFQGQTGAILLNALHLQAEAMCSAQIGGATCPDAQVQAIEASLLAGVKQQLVESSLAVAAQTARETASTVSEQVATQVASTLQSKVVPAVAGALDTILGGVNKLSQGAIELDSGMTKFDQEGIQPLANFVNGKIKVTANKVERLLQLSEDYKSYAGIADNVDGETKFILMIDGKKAE